MRARAFQRTQEELAEMNIKVFRGRSVRAEGAHGTAIFFMLWSEQFTAHRLLQCLALYF